jgi:hypothetical protein
LSIWRYRLPNLDKPLEMLWHLSPRISLLAPVSFFLSHPLWRRKVWCLSMNSSGKLQIQ